MRFRDSKVEPNIGIMGTSIDLSRAQTTGVVSFPDYIESTYRYMYILPFPDHKDSLHFKSEVKMRVQYTSCTSKKRCRKYTQKGEINYIYTPLREDDRSNCHDIKVLRKGQQ